MAGKKKEFFKSIIKAIPFLNMYVPEKADKSKGIYVFGTGDRLPNRLLKWVLDSGVAKRAAMKRAVYIAADGFIDENAAEIQVNPIQTADKLLTEISLYQTYFSGFALQIKRRGAQFEVNVLPVQDIRKRLDGTYLYNPTYSQPSYDRTKDQIIQPFLGKRPVTKEEAGKITDNGELLYVYHKSADNPQYPIPPYYAGIEDIKTSAELQRLDYEAVVNGFIPSAVLTLIGNLDDEQRDSSGRTERDYFDEELLNFTGGIKDADGRSGRMRLLVTTARTKDEAPVLQPFDAKAIIDASNAKRDIIERAVCRWFGVPPVLAGFSDAQILGNTQAIANASNELNNDVLGDQQLISEAMTLIYPEYDWTISTLRPIQYIPDGLMQDLTLNERRALIGYPEITPNDTTDN